MEISASSLTWLDFSERDKRRANQVIDLFRETSTMDELGVATVRQCYSNFFFPGTSTIQTRACYFLLVPWTFRRMENERVPSGRAAEWSRTTELDLNRTLRDCEDNQGVFGSQVGNALKRLPSEIYWGGLWSWGIRLYPGYMQTYFRSLDGFYQGRAYSRRMGRDDPEGKTAPPSNWHPNLPDPPPGFPRNITTTLRKEDAEYLRDRIQARHPQSLLAVLAGRANPDDLEKGWPWDHAKLSEVSEYLREQLYDARLFSISIQGAALLYNLMLSELRENDDWIEDYQEKLAKWASKWGSEIEALGPGFKDWKPDGVWRFVSRQGVRLGYPTRRFVEDWVQELHRNGPEAITDIGSKARELVRNREISLKRNRSRFRSRRHLESWGGDSGTGRLDFRHWAAKRILRDIFEGLE